MLLEYSQMFKYSNGTLDFLLKRVSSAGKRVRDGIQERLVTRCTSSAPVSYGSGAYYVPDVRIQGIGKRETFSVI